MRCLVPVVLLFAVTAVHSLAADPPGIRAAAFSRDGKQFAACAATGIDDGELAVWDTRTWELKFVHREKVGFPRLAFSPDGRLLALARFAPEAHLFHTDTGDLAGCLEGHTNHIRCVTFTPDGSQIVTGSYDRSIKIWDASTHQLLHTIPNAGGDRLYHVDVSPDGRLLAVADGRDYVFRLFDLESREEVFTTERMGSLVAHVTFSPDGKTVAVASWGGYCRVYETDTKRLKWELKTNSADWSAFSPNGKVAVAAINSVYVYSFPRADEETQERIRALIAAFEQDDYQLRESASVELKKLGGVTEPFLSAAMQSDDPEVRMRSRRAGEFLMTTDSAKELSLDAEAECAVFSPDGALLVTGDKAGNLVVWNVDDWTRHREFQIPK